MMAATIAKAPSAGEWSPELASALEQAVDDYGLPNTDDWVPLIELSQNTTYDGFDIDPDSTVVIDGTYHTPGTVYVTLNYDVHSDDPVELSDSYPMTVRFTVNNSQIEIEGIDVDTTSFFE